MKKLTILFDNHCGFCRYCREWMLKQAAYLELEFIPKDSPEAACRFPEIAEIRDHSKPACALSTDELIVISDEGGVYREAEAFLMCLYALVDYREWTEVLSSPTLLPLSRRALMMLSQNRGLISSWLNIGGEDYLAERLKNPSRGTWW